ncbi:MAG TPA: hypothetical protein VFS97_04405 [Nitrososphaeraceae archaeon]|nr:hypothetical protein [Nitrososphaeraceae archaeon]
MRIIQSNSKERITIAPAKNYLDKGIAEPTYQQGSNPTEPDYRTILIPLQVEKMNQFWSYSTAS